MSKWYTYIFFIILSLFSCRPEEIADDPNLGGNQTELKLLSPSLTQMQVGELESKTNLLPGTFQVRIGSVDLSATLEGSNRLFFLLGDEVPAGNHTLSVLIDGESEKTFPIEVKALPLVTNPDAVVDNYVNLIVELNNASESLYDSARIWYNLPNNPAVEATRKKWNDSLTYYLDAFDKLQGPEKLFAAKLIQANLMEMIPIMEAIRDNSLALLNSGFAGKNGSPCADEYTKSAALKCFFDEAQRDLVRLLA
ncbi:MAG: hypothetical protein LPK49_00660, partial [Bacteroidota bacterium]|nr:hypothetical protein [Bacteroidota bacterium]MDX5429530.1 hypothetical protein [Bacteroidota bacterium]